MSEVDLEAALDAVLAPLERSDAPGLIVAAAQHGELRYRKAFGLASVAQGRANTPSTRMRIGSTAKQFTALAVLLVEEEGRLRLDDPVRLHLPELPVWADQTTLRQLLHHTGSVPCPVADGFVASGSARHARGEVWRALRRPRTLSAPPGQRWLYSNGGYHLLSLIVERASGQDFAGFLRERIFQPLGMHASDCVPSDMDITPGLADLHVAWSGGGWRRGVFPNEEMLGEGGIVSTADDMLRWLAHLREPTRLGSAASWSLMLERATLADGTRMPYAMGILHSRHRGIATLVHAGGVVGGACQALAAPEAGIDVVVLSNGAQASVTQLAQRVLELLAGSEEQLQPEGLPHARVSAFPGLAGTTYHAPSTGLQLGFKAVGELLGVSLFGNGAVPLRSDGEFLRLPFEDAGLGPLHMSLQGAGDATLDVWEGALRHSCVRLPEAAGDIGELAPSLCGRYRCADLDADAIVSRGGDDLLLDMHGRAGTQTMQLSLQGRDALTWRVADPVMPLVGTARIEYGAGGEAAALWLNAWSSRQLRFARVPEGELK